MATVVKKWDATATDLPEAVVYRFDELAAEHLNDLEEYKGLDFPVSKAYDQGFLNGLNAALVSLGYCIEGEWR